MEFKYDLRDLKFILKEWLDTEEVLSFDRFKDFIDMDSIDPLLDEAYKIAREVVNPINAPGDKIGNKFENGFVTPPPGYKEVYKFLQENGWGSSSECLEVEEGMPLILYKAINELNSAACPAMLSNIKLTSGAANLIINFGTQEDKERFLPKLLNGDWQATMCITEPNAGSDVGDAITRSYATEDSRLYKIKGTKMFITGGDTGICENTIHMVLARPEGAAKGSSGLGLYIVPKVWVNEDGSLGRDNDVITIGLEEKMGLHGSATTMLNFGENDECYGILVGEAPDEKGRSKGLAMMFNMMNESRTGTGHNAIAQASAAYFFAAQYATERIQGRPFGNNKAERVPIIKHTDIRRMLLDMKSRTEGIRAMIFKSYYYLDMAEYLQDKEQAKKYKGIAELLTPLVKCYGSESAFSLTAEAIQVLGGVGYTMEYPVEQYMRDSKILTIWEGTSFIQANDLVGRKFKMNDGEPFSNWMSMMKGFIDENMSTEGFEKEFAALAKGYQCVAEIKELYDAWYDNLAEKKELIPLYAVRTLFACAELQVAVCLMEQGLIANSRIQELTDNQYELNYYKGKIASAKYFINNILPNAFMLTDIIKNADQVVLECPEESFLPK
ncbi:MAG: acyl-CoA dehydrogenase [Bacillota bacterium]|nr:acyl-CoA dehydrogenase [Bacillota bacterium]